MKKGNIVITVVAILLMTGIIACNAADKLISWPGKNDVITIESDIFSDNSSGLDYHNGYLYAVDNEGVLFIVTVDNNGNISPCEGYENGKKIRVLDDDDSTALNIPDTEGITVDDSDNIYVAAERVKGDKKRQNTIFLLDTDINTVIPKREWILNSLLPEVDKNEGIEAIEWVSFENVNGVLSDMNTGKSFDSSVYPDSVSDGIFLTALEANGHVYAFVLNNDETAVLISDIDTGLDCAMGLDYDCSNSALWVTTDNNSENTMALISFRDELDAFYIKPADGVNKKANNEGFAVTDILSDNRYILVYRFTDGAGSKSLSVNYLDRDYIIEIKDIEHSDNTENSSYIAHFLLFTAPVILIAIIVSAFIYFRVRKNKN